MKFKPNQKVKYNIAANKSWYGMEFIVVHQDKDDLVTCTIIKSHNPGYIVGETVRLYSFKLKLISRINYQPSWL